METTFTALEYEARLSRVEWGKTSPLRIVQYFSVKQKLNVFRKKCFFGGVGGGGVQATV